MGDNGTIEDIKLEVGDQPPTVLGQIPAPPIGMLALQSTVQLRMRGYFDSPGQTATEAVRLLAPDGRELFRWSWWDEQSERQRAGVAPAPDSQSG
jgi:hypothetical protein